MALRISYFSVTEKNRFFNAPLKSHFFGFRIPLFQRATKKRFSSVSEKSLYQSAMENRFFFHKNLVVRYEKVIFSLSKKFLFQGATKKIFFGFRKIAFTVRHEKAFFQGAIKILKFFF